MFATFANAFKRDNQCSATDQDFVVGVVGVEWGLS